MDKHVKDILVIDDDPVFAGLMVELLSQRGYNTDGFGSVVEMGSFACMKMYRLILLDYRLDHLNGIEIAEYVDLFFPNIPVLLTSAYSQATSTTERAKWPECIAGFVSKSEGAAKIVETCDALINQQVIESSFHWEEDVLSGRPVVAPAKRGSTAQWGKDY